MKTRALKFDELEIIFLFIKSGVRRNGIKVRANAQVHLICLIQLNTGLRIGDVLSLKVSDFVDGKLSIKEQKTGKIQNRKINYEVVKIVEAYCRKRFLSRNDNIFDISSRWVQKILKKIAICASIEGLSTHSFRKTYAHIQYTNNKFNIELVRRLLNHSSIAVTQKYLGITDNDVNVAFEGFKVIF